MIAFNDTDFFNMTFFVNVIFSTLVLLGIAAGVLWFINKHRVTGFLKKPIGNISIEEVKSDVRLGTLAIVKAFDQRYLVVVAKTGVSVNQLQPVTDVARNDQEIEEQTKNV